MCFEKGIENSLELVARVSFQSLCVLDIVYQKYVISKYKDL